MRIRSFLHVLEVYFASPVTIVILSATLGAMGALAYMFLRNARIPAFRLGTLTALLSLNLFLWSFLAISLVVCVIEMGDPEYYHVVRFLIGGSFLAALGVASALSAVLWRRAPQALLRRLGGVEEGRPPELQRFLDSMAERLELPAPRLLTLGRPEPMSLALLGKDSYLIVSKGLLDLLDGEEREAVLAHEFMHISHADARVKVFSATLSTVLFFDPITRLIDAAAHREREYLADQEAAMATLKPSALASALVKVAGARAPREPVVSAMTISSRPKGLLSRHPPLKERVDRLLALSNIIEAKVPGEVPVNNHHPRATPMGE